MWELIVILASNAKREVLVFYLLVRVDFLLIKSYGNINFVFIGALELRLRYFCSLFALLFVVKCNVAQQKCIGEYNVPRYYAFFVPIDDYPMTLVEVAR